MYLVHAPRRKNAHFSFSAVPRTQKLSKSSRDQAARFQIDLDDIREESTVQDVLFGVEERNIDWLISDKTEELAKIATTSTVYSKDDGFPEPMDLSAYYSDKSDKRSAPVGKSFFAAEFDRIHGNLAENLEYSVENEPEMAGNQGNDDFEAENEKYLASLDTDKILELRKEIEERFDPKLLEFLANRGKNARNPEKEPKKVSKFKAQRQKEKEKPEKSEKIDNPVEKVEKMEEPPKKEIEEMMNELEVLEEWANREDQEKYNRLATVGGKIYFSVICRQFWCIVRGFDSKMHRL